MFHRHSGKKQNKKTDSSAYHAVIARFNRSYDDSSDEEDEFDGFDINKCWKQVQSKTRAKSRNKLADDKLFSFCLHYAAHEWLCSKRVSQQYYALKKQVLRHSGKDQDAVSQLYRRVALAVHSAVDETFTLIKRFLLLTNQNEVSDEDIKRITKRVKEDFIKKADELILSDLTIFIKWIKRNRASDNDERVDKVNDFENDLTRLFVKEFMQHFSFDESDHDRRKVKKNLLVLAKERVADITADFGFDKKAYNDGKIDAIHLLKQYTGPYQHLIKNIASLLEDCPARGLVVKLITNKLTKKKTAEKLTKDFIEDLIKIKNRLPREEQDAFNEYFTYNSVSLHDELSGHFQTFLHNHLKRQMKSFHRPVLKNDYSFDSKDHFELLCYIRLLNRSQTRNRRNLQHSIFKEDMVVRRWRLFDPPVKGADVSEIQRILKTSFGRMDMVLGLGNYENVYSYIEDIKAHYHDNGKDISDDVIAGWFRTILNGCLPDLDVTKENRIEVLRKLQAITYLIFGCESARNPATIIISQMILDLIIESPKWNFEEAFRCMPMVPEGAVASARALENEYQDNMPYAYSYHGVSDAAGVSAMVGQEARIVREWIALKGGKPEEISQNHIAQWVLDLIKEQYERWFLASPDIPLENDDKNIKLRK